MVALVDRLAALPPEAPEPRKREIRFTKTRKYPGRNRVMHRSDAADAKMAQWLRDEVYDTPERNKCENPFITSAIGLRSRALQEIDVWEGKPIGKVPVEFQGRCRKCAPCLAHRRKLWTARAIDELHVSSRNWFATLTVNPEKRFLVKVDAASRAKAAGHGEWWQMSTEDQFIYLGKVLAEEITRWFKRVRKKSGTSFRYLLICEPHADGFPHYHALIHEQALPVTKRCLEETWRYGFSQFRLMDGSSRTARYVSKYLSKDARTRVRASRHYGRAHKERSITEAVMTATRAISPEDPACPKSHKGPP